LLLAKNSRHLLNITELTPEGLGCGFLDSVPVVVANTLPGEEAEITLIKVTPRLAVGKLLNLRRAAPERVPPVCPVFPRCGSCHLLHLAYPAQLAFKQTQIQEAFRAARVPLKIPIPEVLGMSQPFHFRHKAQYPVAVHQQQIQMGFYANHSHRIVEHAACPVQPVEFDTIRMIVQQWLIAHQISIYDETRQTGLFRHLMVRKGLHTGEIMVVCVVNGAVLPHAADLIERLLAGVSRIVSITLNTNQADTNIILGERQHVLSGRPTLTDRLGDLTVELSANAFYQGNPSQMETLYAQARQLSDLHGTETILDLYCGIGTLTLFLAGQAQHIYGIEHAPAAIADAQRNAQRNQVANVTFLSGTVEEQLPQLAQQGIQSDVIIVDPPRQGCTERVLTTIVHMQPARLIYIACHPIALARDVRYLTTHGFTLQALHPVDMFPHTRHIECVAALTW
jgi:23S rRNA (uracil1939-C5)-methyltransferase